MPIPFASRGPTVPSITSGTASEEADLVAVIGTADFSGDRKREPGQDGQVALSDAAQFLAPPPPAVTMELYFWSRWITAQYIPGVRGLMTGAHLARRMRDIGIESLAGGIKFDTSS
jgi:hypothetical protein